MSEEDSSSYQIFEVKCNPALNFKYKLRPNPKLVTESQETVKVNFDQIIDEENPDIQSILTKYKQYDPQKLTSYRQNIQPEPSESLHE